MVSAPDPTGRSLLVLIDPAARRADGEAVRIARDVLSAAADTKICLPESAAELARALARRGGRRPVVIGDDLAFMRVVSELRRQETLGDAPLALVPVGPARTLAATLGVPTGTVDAARTVLDGEERRLGLLVDDGGGVVLDALRLPAQGAGPDGSGAVDGRSPDGRTSDGRSRDGRSPGGRSPGGAGTVAGSGPGDLTTPDGRAAADGRMPDVGPTPGGPSPHGAQAVAGGARTESGPPGGAPSGGPAGGLGGGLSGGLAGLTQRVGAGAGGGPGRRWTPAAGLRALAARAVERRNGTAREPGPPPVVTKWGAEDATGGWESGGADGAGRTPGDWTPPAADDPVPVDVAAPEDGFRLRVEADGVLLADLDGPASQVRVVTDPASGLAQVIIRPRGAGDPLHAQARSVRVWGSDFRYRADALLSPPVSQRTWTAHPNAWRLITAPPH
ncbi:diacylglycerol kinase family protein [Streptomyces sp. 184]|uniref:diacylglycerol kinase family protein n=1 Tax=Streptomyces sp. 184 TaxID=1827526 RepID=UPI00389121CE